MRKLYEKSKIWFAVVWIAAYCLLMSAGDALSDLAEIEKSVTLPVGILLSIVLLVFLKKNGLFRTYGLRTSEASPASMLFYLPVVGMLTANLWYGLTLNYTIPETVLYIFTMFCVGFLEELIFRGLLFRAMEENSFRWAVVVSSVTFGFGHIINLFNGSGAELIPSLLQIVYATAAGFMFTMIYCKTKSLILCIVTHGLFNALSAFAKIDGASVEKQILFSILLTGITGAYGTYLATTLRKKKKNALSNEG